MSINITEIYNPKIIATVHTEVASNKIPYLGEGLFPSQKKTGLDVRKFDDALTFKIAIMVADHMKYMRA